MDSFINIENNIDLKIERVCLNENLENIATSVLSNVKAIKNCKELQHVTHIKESINNGFIKANKQSNSIKLLEDTLNTSSALQIHPGKSNKSNPLQKRYFKKWQIYITKKKGDKEQSSETVVQKEKLHQFLKTLNRYQRQKSQVNEPPIRFKCKKDTFNKSNSNKLNDTYFNISTAKENHYNNYKHRFVAQQKIIDVQKRKLIEQEEIIDELKLGKLEKDINKSIIEAEEQIQETLKNTSFKVKQNISPILISTVQNELEQFRLNSNKAPKIVQQMEKRAFERQQKHKLILERKCIIEQTRKQAIQKEIERKKLQDEEQKIQNLEELKARRIKEMNIRKKIQMQKLQFLENRQKVDSFYRKKLLKFGFESFLLLIQIKSNNYFESHEHYKNSLKRKVFNNWINFINKINDEKYAKARNFYNLKLKKEIMRLWMKFYRLNRQNMQVAEDFYEMNLQSKTFIHWHIFVCKQYVLDFKKKERAKTHWERRTLIHYYYQWKSLPAVIQLEKVKEEKKRKWREKVWEILPNYDPIFDVIYN